MWRYMADGSKLECCITGNLPQGLSLVLNGRIAMLGYECSLTQKRINTINLRTLELETFNILKVDRHIQEYGRYTVITEK